MKPLLPEAALDTVRVQAIKLHRRKHIIMAMGTVLCLMLGGSWWYCAMESNLENKILEQSGAHVSDGLEDMEPIPMAPKEEFSNFKVEVMDDGPLYAQAEEAFLQRVWPVAIQKYMKLIKLYPHNQALWFNLALAHHHHGDLEQARYWYEKVLLHDPQHRGAKRNLKVLHEIYTCS